MTPDAIEFALKRAHPGTRWLSLTHDVLSLQDAHDRRAHLAQKLTYRAVAAPWTAAPGEVADAERRLVGAVASLLD